MSTCYVNCSYNCTCYHSSCCHCCCTYSNCFAHSCTVVHNKSVVMRGLLLLLLLLMMKAVFVVVAAVVEVVVNIENWGIVMDDVDSYCEVGDVRRTFAGMPNVVASCLLYFTDETSWSVKFYFCFLLMLMLMLLLVSTLSAHQSSLKLQRFFCATFHCLINYYSLQYCLFDVHLYGCYYCCYLPLFLLHRRILDCYVNYWCHHFQRLPHLFMHNGHFIVNCHDCNYNRDHRYKTFNVNIHGN